MPAEFQRLIVDTTVQEKVSAYLMDGRPPTGDRAPQGEITAARRTLLECGKHVELARLHPLGMHWSSRAPRSLLVSANYQF